MIDSPPEMSLRYYLPVLEEEEFHEGSRKSGAIELPRGALFDL